MESHSQVPTDNEASTQCEDVFIKDVITSETNHVASKPPVKKQTRQWAAWTRQEEESFFTALRQVGKNFEKITSRVQSKNKDQVRHYYYRLVRRMNKLLGPELSLDAKNSKDTNAAMLRWWSLLEKHSCKASKLHLKPRRFKIFLETLEHQLLKDRKKKLKKRHFQGENCSITPSNSVNIVLVDSQNIQNVNSGKGGAIRRNAGTCLDRNNCKGDLSTVKQARQRRRSGGSSTAAYKKWEKAAIAGVSLVADAAAHLEQTALNKLVESVQYMHGEKSCLNPITRDIPRVPSFHQNTLTTNNVQPLTKLKLQLFPINEEIRRALEMDNHNPHLELTLSSKKKISSVFERINYKWGSCSIASGELILVPYYAESIDLTSCQKWTQNSILTAADVYSAIGSPTVFRLRYGWFANAPQESLPTGPALEDKGCNKNAAVSVFEWADSLTNISVGDLLGDLSRNANVSNVPAGAQIPFSCDSFDAAIAAIISKTDNDHNNNSNSNSNNDGVQHTVASSSIWDAEETCDAFTFHKNNVTHTIKETNPIEKVAEAEVELMDECRSGGNPEDGSTKDLHVLTDLYWPDSLGPLEVDLHPCRYQSNDLILTESLGGLTRILTSSLDGFSLFGLERRETENKIGS